MLIAAIILIIPLVLLLNVLLFHFLIKKAIKAFVKPELARKGLIFMGYKWVGFLGCGDFKNEQMEFALFKTSLNSISIYSFIDYKDFDNIKRVTVKINVLGLSVGNVIYSNDL